MERSGKPHSVHISGVFVVGEKHRKQTQKQPQTKAKKQKKKAQKEAENTCVEPAEINH